MKILNFLKNIIKSKKDKSSGSCETITVIEPIKNQDQSKNNDAYLGLGTYKKPLVLKGIPYGVGGAGGSTPRTHVGCGGYGSGAGGNKNQCTCDKHILINHSLKIEI